MENWEEILSDGQKKDPDQGLEPDSSSTVRAEGESLFIVEGLQDPNSTEPELVPVDAPITPEEEAQSEELTPISIDLGIDVPETVAQATRSEGLVEVGGQAPSSPELEDQTQEPMLSESGEPEMVASASGTPKLFLWGSIAAGLICMICAGLIWWKKSQPEMDLPQMATAPVKAVKPAPVKPIEAPETKPVEAESPVSVPVEEELAVVSPLPFEDMTQGETLLGKQLNQSVGELMGLSIPESSRDRVAKAPETGSLPITESPLSSAEPTQVPALEPSMGPELPKTAADRFAIRRGPAMIQLKNGNFFSGKIMNTTEQGMILRMPDGEMVFALDAIEQVLPMGSQGSTEMFPNGYVELSNGNRVWGKIMTQGEQSVTVSTGPAKIVIPRPQIIYVKMGNGVVVRQESVQTAAGQDR